MNSQSIESKSQKILRGPGQHIYTLSYCATQVLFIPMAPPQLDDAPTGLIPNILCKQYHAAQRDGFDVLFRGEQWAVWACRQYPVNAREYSRSLASSEVETIIAKLLPQASNTSLKPMPRGCGVSVSNPATCRRPDISHARYCRGEKVANFLTRARHALVGACAAPHAPLPPDQDELRLPPCLSRE